MSEQLKPLTLAEVAALEECFARVPLTTGADLPRALETIRRLHAALQEAQTGLRDSGLWSTSIDDALDELEKQP